MIKEEIHKVIVWSEYIKQVHKSESIDEKDYLGRVLQGSIDSSSQLLYTIAETDSGLVKGILLRTLMEISADIRTILKSQNPISTAKKFVIRSEKVMQKSDDNLVKTRGIITPELSGTGVWKGEPTIDGKGIMERIDLLDFPSPQGASRDMYEILCHFTHASMLHFKLSEQLSDPTLDEHALITYMGNIATIMKKSEFFTRDDIIELQSKNIIMPFNFQLNEMLLNRMVERFD